jgi:hypothetical protein
MAALILALPYKQEILHLMILYIITPEQSETPEPANMFRIMRSGDTIAASMM